MTTPHSKETKSRSPSRLALLIPVVFACFGLSPVAQAVNPPPDGGYPNFTTAEGQNALQSLTSGAANTALGAYSLFSNTTASFNTAVGAGALLFNTADANTAIGAAALLSNTIGLDNTANGVSALATNTQGSGNTATGFDALFSNTSGGGNTAVGVGALENNTTGNFNTALGAQAGFGVTTGDNVICIGAAGQNVNNSCFIGNIRGVTTANADAIQVMIDSAGQLGTVSSSRRYKTDIKPMDKGSESILALKPVSFRYKAHKDATPQFGLIAEQVAEVNPDLVVRDKNGEIYTVRYDAVNAMLLNEFLKEHRKVQELQATVARQQKSFDSKLMGQQKQIEALTVGLQKVSAQLEASKPAPQVAENNR